MNIYRIIFLLGKVRSSKQISNVFGNDFAKSFNKQSSEMIDKVISKTPPIGKTIFSFNYAFTPAYIVWYQAAKRLGLNKCQTEQLLWLLNEKIVKTIPRFLAKAFATAYLNRFRQMAPKHEELIKQGKIHPYDYLLSFRNLGKYIFEIDITRCGMMTLAKDFDAMGIFPTVCRVDYIMSNYMGAGFERTKTLGDGDECCNCRYIIGGGCEWAPEKGFEIRK